MIRVSVLYPNGEGSKFDMDYYCTKHIPMVQEKLGAACKGVTVEQGIGGAEPESSAPFAALCHLLIDSIEDFHAAFGLHGVTFMEDVPNYTNIQPVIQISIVRI